MSSEVELINKTFIVKLNYTFTDEVGMRSGTVEFEVPPDISDEDLKELIAQAYGHL